MLVILHGINLLAAAVIDLREHVVYRVQLLEYLFLSLAVLVLQNGMEQEQILQKILAGSIPGVMMFFLAWGTKESVGYGDALLVLILGISLGIEQSLQILFCALFWSAIAGIALCIVRRTLRNAELPFVPFLFIGWIIQTLV